MSIDTFAKQDMNEVNRTILRQYRECTGALDELFTIAPDQCWKKNGIGCCDTDKKTAEKGLIGPARNMFMDMRNALIPLTGNIIMVGNACPYHKKGSGCVLGELKSPICATWYCSGDLPKGKRDTSRYDRTYVMQTLMDILAGRYNQKAGTYHPEQNEDLVREFKAYVGEVIQTTLKTLLREDERSDIDRRVAKWGCTIAHAYERIKYEKSAAEAVKPYIKANERRRQAVRTER